MQEFKHQKLHDFFGSVFLDHQVHYIDPLVINPAFIFNMHSNLAPGH